MPRKTHPAKKKSKVHGLLCPYCDSWIYNEPISPMPYDPEKLILAAYKEALNDKYSVSSWNEQHKPECCLFIGEV